MSALLNPSHYFLYLIRFYAKVCLKICPPWLSWKYYFTDKEKGFRKLQENLAFTPALLLSALQDGKASGMHTPTSVSLADGSFQRSLTKVLGKDAAGRAEHPVRFEGDTQRIILFIISMRCLSFV